MPAFEAAFVRLHPLMSLIARAMLALLFINEGIGKIRDYGDVADYMRQFHVSPSLLPLVILTELGGGLLTLLGIATRPAAVAIAGFCLLTAWLFHGVSDAGEWIQTQKDIAIAGGYLLLACNGPGDWSVEGLLRRRWGQKDMLTEVR